MGGKKLPDFRKPGSFFLRNNILFYPRHVRTWVVAVSLGMTVDSIVIKSSTNWNALIFLRE